MGASRVCAIVIDCIALTDTDLNDNSRAVHFTFTTTDTVNRLHVSRNRNLHN